MNRAHSNTNSQTSPRNRKAGAAVRESASVARALMAWFRKHGRHDLPWRHTADAYRILVSEMMLQQTQVSRVMPFYVKWLQRFPNLAALAHASEADALAVWRGLGYYRRARSLKKLADHLVEHGQRRLPASYDELLRLPGVGPYTAAAVMAFAHNQPYAPVDTNVRRVIARVFGLGGGGGDTAACEPHVVALYHRCAPREVAAALMDLGAAVCTARAPQCGQCPLRKLCKAYAGGDVSFSSVPALAGRSLSVPALAGRSVPVDVSPWEFALLKQGATPENQVRKRSNAAKTPSRRRVAPRAQIAVGALRDGKRILLPVRGGLLVASIGGGARGALQAYAREKYGVEIAVRPAYTRGTFKGKHASFHRCSLLYGDIHRFTPADVKRLARLSRDEQTALRRMKLL